MELKISVKSNERFGVTGLSWDDRSVTVHFASPEMVGVSPIAHFEAGETAHFTLTGLRRSGQERVFQAVEE